MDAKVSQYRTIQKHWYSLKRRKCATNIDADDRQIWRIE
jgi:hypothetical protein